MLSLHDDDDDDNDDNGVVSPLSPNPFRFLRHHHPVDIDAIVAAMESGPSWSSKRSSNASSFSASSASTRCPATGASTCWTWPRGFSLGCGTGTSTAGMTCGAGAAFRGTSGSWLLWLLGLLLLLLLPVWLLLWLLLLIPEAHMFCCRFLFAFVG